MTTETWTYLGQRLGRDGKVSHVWRDADGEELWFGKLKGYHVGGLYEVEVTRKPEGGMTAKQDMKWVATAEDADVVTLEAKGAMREIERHRLEKSAARQDALDEAVQPILALAARTKSHAAKQAMVDYITRRIWTG